MEKKTALVITHKQCNDGLAAAWVIYNHFNNRVIDLKEEDIYFLAHTGKQLDDLERLGFWQKLHDHPEIETIYVTDFSLDFDPLNLIATLFPHVKVVEIDHHKTAFERDQETMNVIHDLKLAGRYESYMDNRMSGAVLTWLYFNNGYRNEDTDKLNQEELDTMLDQEVPKWILYIQDRDIWKWRYPESKAFCYTFMNMGLGLDDLGQFFYSSVVESYINKGDFGLLVQQNQINLLLENTTDIVYPLDGKVLKGKAVNVNQFFTSDIGNQLVRQKGVDFALTYSYNGEYWKCGLRSKTDVDVSKIASAFGGGGHAQASGFSWRKSIDELLNGLKEGVEE
nr:MAG TPA: exopolyphosphatase-related protein [Caudoviricetes sp.]